MVVYVIRHAWAEEPDSARWPDDSLRPLTQEGRARFRRFARRLMRRGMEISLVGTSPYTRCAETAEILVSVSKEPMAVEVVPALAPKGSFEELLQWLGHRSEAVDGNIALVGHAPDVEEIISRLIGGGRINCSKGAVATIEFPDKPAAGEGRLTSLVSASLLKC